MRGLAVIAAAVVAIAAPAAAKPFFSLGSIQKYEPPPELGNEPVLGVEEIDAKLAVIKGICGPKAIACYAEYPDGRRVIYLPSDWPNKREVKEFRKHERAHAQGWTHPE